MTVYTDISQVPLFRYSLIMADPAWTFETYSEKGWEKAPQAHYRCMPLDEIKALRVGDLAAPDCLLWLWAINPMLPEAIEVMRAWGFQFKTAGHWSKKTKHGKQHFGPGYVLRGAGEPFLIGTIGKPWTAKNVRSVIEGQVRDHSRKPEEAFEAAERLCGDAHRLELFSRQERPGWDVMGDEVGRFAA